VARSIARAHGGDVELANSHPGLTARVRLPLAPGGPHHRSARDKAHAD
jgi:signal transduction histidine kinase